MSTPTPPQPPRLAVQAFWLTASKLVAAALNIGLPILLVRLMPQTEYGIYKQAFLFVTTTANIATLGVGMTAFYFMPRLPERGGQIALNILVYNFIAGWIPLIALALYPQILQSLFRTDALGPLALLLGFLVLLTLSASLIQQIATALQDIRYSTLFVIGTQVSRVIMLGGAAVSFRSVESVLVAALIHQILSLPVLFWYLHKKFPRFWAHFDWQFFKEQLGYALPYAAVGVLWVIQRDLDNYFVSALLGPADFAIYSVGWIDVPLLSLALESVVSVLIIRVSALQQQNRKAEIRALTAAATTRFAALQLPLFAILFLAGHDLIVLLYTGAYERSADIFLISILLLPLGALLVEPIARAYKELRGFVLVLRISTFVFLCCALAPVIHHFGMIGATVTAVAARAAEHLIIAWRAARAVDASLRDVRLYVGAFKVMGATLVAALVAWFVRNLIDPALLIPRLLVVPFAIAAVYLPAVLVLRLPGWEMLSRDRLLSLAKATLRSVKSA
ncbi:MAG TPA: oligosaccharide flippase family protein [Steroidobacteraceae bacterium]|nr:oligosaccharide flippase family protein [Steroidobacteraceae bacterium]